MKNEVMGLAQVEIEEIAQQGINILKAQWRIDTENGCTNMSWEEYQRQFCE